MPSYPKEPHAYQPQLGDGTPVMPIIVLAPSQAVASQVVHWRKLSVREALAAVEGGAQTIVHIPPTDDAVAEAGTDAGEVGQPQPLVGFAEPADPPLSAPPSYAYQPNQSGDAP